MSDQLDRRIRRMMERVVDESPPPPEAFELRPITAVARPRIPKWTAAIASAAVVLLLIGGAALLLPMGNGGPGDGAASTTVATAPPATAVPPMPGGGDGQKVAVTVSGLSDHPWGELAGVLYLGSELTDLDDDALGGFWWVLNGDDTTTEVVRQPADDAVAMFPYVSAEALTVAPGTYTLVLWVDAQLTPVTRWVPINSDGQGLLGCHISFDVTNDAQTDVAVTANLEPNGWNINCTTGQATPGTNSNDPVTPSDWPPPEPGWPTDMPPVTGVGDGQTVEVAVSGVSGHAGDDLAGVLYEGGELTDLDDDALGGFWWVVSEDEDATTTEVVRQPATPGDGRFPYVSDQALTVEPGTYTLVLWVDDGLGPARRWVPVNTDGMGLFGCHVVFDVTDDAQTQVTVTANLEPDGWNINCTTGQAIPGTNSAEAVAP